MRAMIYDENALRAITPASLAAFARAEGWTPTERFGKHSNVFAAEKRPEVIIPRTDQLADYARVVSDLISVFSDALEVDEILTYRMLVGADNDVIRVRSKGADGDGSIELDEGVMIVSQSREMLLAAACAAKTPQPLFRAGANRDAIEYLKRVRMGQTEQGSYVVTLLAPVPPSLQQSFDYDELNAGDEPFERKVTLRLLQALEAAKSASEEALIGNTTVFEESIKHGVSANLCEALSAMIEESNGLDISLTWSKTRPRKETRNKVTFGESDADVLKEAARLFRSKQPQPDVTLYGSVFKLKRDDYEVDGLVTLRAMVEDRVQSISAILDQTNYSKAVRAHDSKLPVIVHGDLERVGQRWQLTNASIQQLEDSSEDSVGDLPERAVTLKATSPSISNIDRSVTDEPDSEPKQLPKPDKE